MIGKDLLKKRSETLVVSLVGENLAYKWWNSANKAFEGETPLSEFEKDAEKVYEYLLLHTQGAW